MAFTTISYLLFLPLCLGAVFLVPKKLKNPLLLAASWCFYLCAGSPGYLFFLLFGTLVAYCFGLWLEKAQTHRARLALLWGGIGIQLAVLVFFKYAGLFTDAFARFALDSGLLYASKAGGVLSLAAPLGISYYTFQTVGYLADVFHKKVPAERDFIRYALFVSFFPQITSGPIARADKLLPQLDGNYRFDYSRTVSSLQLMLFGFFKKIAVADMLMMTLGELYGNLFALNGMTLFFLTPCYLFWLYCDFSGWCDIAVATARLFGIELIRNFETPLFSCSIQEFWRRWHISLSTWLRDYIYFPLGGSRCSTLRRCVNLMIVFLLSGIWHGAGFNFFLWGALFGLFQIAENFLHSAHGRTVREPHGFARLAKNVITYFAVSFAFIFFSTPAFSDALHVAVHQFMHWQPSAFWGDILSAVGRGFNSTPLLGAAYLAFCVLCTGIVFFADHRLRFHLGGGDISKGFARMKPLVRWLCYYGLLALILAAFLMNNGYYGRAVSTAYGGF